MNSRRVQEQIEWARERAANSGMVLTLALNYSARKNWWMPFAGCSSRLSRRRRHPLVLDEDAVGRHLHTRYLPEPDLVIRTSGEMR